MKRGLESAKSFFTRPIGDGLFKAECRDQPSLSAVGFTPEEAESSLMQLIEDRFLVKSSLAGRGNVSPKQDDLGEVE